MSSLELAYNTENHSAMFQQVAERIQVAGQRQKEQGEGAWMAFEEMDAIDQRLIARMSIFDPGQGTASIRPYAARAGSAKSHDENIGDLAANISDWFAETRGLPGILTANQCDTLAVYIMRNWP